MRFYLSLCLSLSLFSLSLTVCANYMGNPIFLEKSKTVTKYQKNEQKSNALAAEAWAYLHRYQSENDRYSYSIVHAQDYFNFSYSHNHDNYNVYWGWGIIRGIQATMTGDKLLVEKYLLQCVEFLSMVPKYNCPAAELSNLELDLVNAYNLMGSFYLQTNERGKALTALNKAQKILESLHKKLPSNGRYFFLYAVNQFWQENFAKSMSYVNDAKKLNYPIPNDFFEKLNECIKKQTK